MPSIKRRTFLVFTLFMGLPCISLGHTPYRQWKVLRQRFLLIHSTRTNPLGDAIADKLAAILQDALPKANARVARARHEQRAASLLTTGQAVLLVMKKDDAKNLFTGTGNFRGYDGKQVRVLLMIGGGEQLLLTTESFSPIHVRLIAEAFDHHSSGLKIKAPDERLTGIPGHRAAAQYFLRNSE